VYLGIAAIFAGLKLSAATADPLLSLASRFGFPVAIAADPTDLIALAVLPPSFAAWSACRRRRPPRTRALPRALALAVAALSIVATSGPPQPSVSTIAIDGSGDVYATVESSASGDGVYIADLDAGSWHRLTTAPGRLVADPARRGMLYLVGSQSVPTVHRLTAEGVAPIGPPDPGNRAPAPYGPVVLVVAPWAAGTLLLARNGDVLMSSDDGASWSDLRPPAEVRGLAVSSERGVIYVATTSSLGDGVGWLYRSRDAGLHWTFMETFDIGTFEDAMVAVHPDDGRLVFLGTATALRRSTDAGVSFTTVISPREGTNWSWRLRFDPSDPDHFFLVQGFGCCPLLESRDRGLTWSDAGIDATEVAIDPRGNVYVVSGGRDKVLRRVGTEWVDVTYSLPVQRSR